MIGQAQAAVQAAQASLDQAKLNLSYTHIVAPATGVVDNETVQVGQRVQPGEQLLTVVPLNDIWITADFRESHRCMERKQVIDMRAMRAEQFSGYKELKLVDLPKPVGTGEKILLRIATAGVTPLDHTILSGQYPRRRRHWCWVWRRGGRG
jgi:Barrel-sandwich domain of CusB or HlyD membrane-fusion